MSPVPSVMLNATVNELTQLKNLDQGLATLATNATKDWTPDPNVPTNLVAKIADARKNVQAAISDLQALYDGYIAPNSAP